MKKIHLGGKHGSVIGNYALVDDADYEWLNQWKWFAQMAYNEAAIKYHGKFARLNIIS